MNANTLSFVDTLNIVPDAAVVVDSRGYIMFANSVVADILGHSQDDLVNQPVSMLIPERYRADHARNVTEFQRWGTRKLMSTRSIIHALNADGREVPVTIGLSNFEADGKRYTLAVLRDATVTDRSIRLATTRAERDELTQLGNRSLLRRVLKTACNEQNEPFALLYLDLCGFKPFNDRHGHHTGDRVLQEVARRISACVRPADTVVRLGGDEFVILMRGVHHEPALNHSAERIARAVGEPLTSLGLEDRVTANIGCAIFPHDAGDPERLLRHADRSMYEAKQRGVNISFAAHCSLEDTSASVKVRAICHD